MQPFRIVLSDVNPSSIQMLEIFALLNLGFVQSLASGVLTPTEALPRFYHANNCLYVRKHFRNRDANAIMSHGVPLPDLFDCLPAEEAQGEFYHELEIMREGRNKLTTGLKTRVRFCQVGRDPSVLF